MIMKTKINTKFDKIDKQSSKVEKNFKKLLGLNWNIKMKKILSILIILILSGKSLAEDISGKIFCNHTSSIGNIYALGIEFWPGGNAFVDIETSLKSLGSFDSNYTTSATRIKIMPDEWIKRNIDFIIEVNRQNLEVYILKIENINYIEGFIENDCRRVDDEHIELLFKEVFKDQRKTNLLWKTVRKRFNIKKTIFYN